MSKQGLKLAAAYSYMPNFLGFCGPQGKRDRKIIKSFLEGKYKNFRQVEKILRGFVGAYTYYKLIARKNNIKDPFDEKVAEAYWIGNNLLDKVKYKDIQELILEDFTEPGLLKKEKAIELTKKIPKGVNVHHSFHVLHIGSVTDVIELKGRLLDLCRVCWGRVENVGNATTEVRKSQRTQKKSLIIEYKPLVLRPKVHLGKARKKEILWNKRFLPNIKIGDIVSFHWGFTTQVLNKRQARNLEKYTQQNIKVLNK